MTRDETKQLLMMMAASYPNYKPADKTVTINTWSMFLESYDWKLVQGAFKAFVTSDTSGFAPSIGQLIEKIRMLEQPTELNEMEAWSLVRTAIRNGANGSEKEFQSLPPLVQKAVGTHHNLRNWAMAEESSVETVIHSNFIRSYRGALASHKEYTKMPDDLQKIMDRKKEETMAITTKKNIPYVSIEKHSAILPNDLDMAKKVPLPDWLQKKLDETKRGMDDGEGQKF